MTIRGLVIVWQTSSDVIAVVDEPELAALVVRRQGGGVTKSSGENSRGCAASPRLQRALRLRRPRRLCATRCPREVSLAGAALLRSNRSTRERIGALRLGIMAAYRAGMLLSISTNRSEAEYTPEALIAERRTGNNRGPWQRDACSHGSSLTTSCRTTLLTIPSLTFPQTISSVPANRCGRSWVPYRARS